MPHSGTTVSVPLIRHDTGETIVLLSPRLVVAGYTGRDEASVRAHIDELAAIGVPAPESVPEFYDLDPALITTDAVIPVASDVTSGEVEAVLVRHQGQFFVGVGSDHTNRDLERTSVFAAKAACPKPLGRVVAALPAPAETDWDSMTCESEVDGVAYQDGRLSSLRPPPEVLARLTERLGNFDEDLVLFCGTVPLLAGRFVAGTHWTLVLHVGKGITLTHSYTADKK